ncbi:MAG: uridine kinase [Desulfitibacter sp. BRH_c19]|nr:MAG: uridine kinase [Desulfitibacter sp. BRH_c19]
MIVVGIAGGTGSGKSTVANAIVESLGINQVALIAQDSYYLDRSDLTLAERGLVNFDHPDAFENDLLVDHLRQLRHGKAVKIPIYDFSTHTRLDKTVMINPKSIIVVEGIMVLTNEMLREMFDIKVFVDTDSDIRVLRRIVRDIKERSRTIDSVIEQYQETVKPMHDAFVEPSKKYADIIIPEGGFNNIAINMLTSTIRHGA